MLNLQKIAQRTLLKLYNFKRYFFLFIVENDLTFFLQTNIIKNKIQFYTKRSFYVP